MGSLVRVLRAPGAHLAVLFVQPAHLGWNCAALDPCVVESTEVRSIIGLSGNPRQRIGDLARTRGLWPFDVTLVPVTTALILGSGWVGRAIAAQPGIWTSSILANRTTYPWLAAGDTAAGAELRDFIERNGVTTVINTAGKLAGPHDELVAANVDFVRWLVDSLQGVEIRLVHLGSASEYGDPGTAEPIPETAPCRPQGPYGETKHAGVNLVLDAMDRGLNAVVARGFNICGSGLPPTSPLGQWLTDVAALPEDGGTIRVWEAQTFRDFIRLDDLARGVARLSVIDEPPAIVNICSGVGLFYGEIVQWLLQASGKTAEVVSLDQGGIMSVVGDPRLFRSITGLDPQMSYQIIANESSARSSE